MSDSISSGGPPPQVPQPQPYWQPPAREGRPVSFYVAIFLALLLVVSAGLNLLLLVVNAFGSLTGDFSTMSIEDESGYRVVQVGGEPSARTRILRIPIDGAIAEGASPLIGATGGTVTQVNRALRLAARDSSIRAVLFDINSPGGGVTDSDMIHRAVNAFRKAHPDKPVIALLGDIAASGGYYVAAACSKVYVRATTITGSIGVILQTWNVSEAMKNLGIDQVTIVSERTPYKDLLSPTRPPKPEEITMLRSIVDEMYDRFVDVVHQGRPGLTREQVIAVASGALYSAKQAVANGLADGVMDTNEVLTWLSDNYADIGPAQLVEQRRVPNLFDSLFGMTSRGRGIDGALHQLLDHPTGSKLLYYWPGGR